MTSFTTLENLTKMMPVASSGTSPKSVFLTKLLGDSQDFEMSTRPLLNFEDLDGRSVNEVTTLPTFLTNTLMPLNVLNEDLQDINQYVEKSEKILSDLGKGQEWQKTSKLVSLISNILLLYNFSGSSLAVLEINRIFKGGPMYTNGVMSPGITYLNSHPQRYHKRETLCTPSRKTAPELWLLFP